MSRCSYNPARPREERSKEERSRKRALKTRDVINGKVEKIMVVRRMHRRIMVMFMKRDRSSVASRAKCDNRQEPSTFLPFTVTCCSNAKRLVHQADVTSKSHSTSLTAVLHIKLDTIADIDAIDPSGKNGAPCWTSSVFRKTS